MTLLLLAACADAPEPPPDLHDAPAQAVVTLRLGVDVGFFPGGADASPIGPDQLAAGPGRTLAMHDVVRGQVVVLDPGGVTSRWDTDRVDGLAFMGTRLLAVLDGPARTLARHAVDGTPVDTLAVEGVADDEALELRDEVIWAHRGLTRRPLARVDGDALVAVDGPLLDLVADGDRWTLGEDGPPVDDGPHRALRRVGGDPVWLEVVDLELPAGPVRAQRAVLRPGTGERVTLARRAPGLRPRDDLAVDADGRLVVLMSRPLHVDAVWYGDP